MSSRQSHHAASKPVVDGGKSSFHYGSSTTGKADQETQSPVLKIFTDMLAREKGSFQGYRGIPLNRHQLKRPKSSDPEKAALLRAEHKRDRDSKREDRRADDRKDDGKRDDSDERRRRSTKKTKKAKKRSSSNPKSKEKKEKKGKKKLKAKISCHCHKNPSHTLICDDESCQYDAEGQSSSKEDVVLEDKVREETRVATTTREEEFEDDGERIYEHRERVRERNFKRKTDDTCSCASCVLKKMCRNDCICYCCVAFVFIFCLLLTFILICKSIPCLRSKYTLFGTPDELEGDRLKRKIDMPADMQWDMLDKKHRISNKWEYDRLPDHPVPHSMDSTGYGDSHLSHEGELTKIIDPDKLSAIQSNEQLREFYKKLVSTDAQIRKLKKEYLFNIETTNSLPYPDRAKRSLDVLKNPFRMFHPKKKIKETTTESKATIEAVSKQPNAEQLNKVTTKEPKDERVKRFNTNEDGLLIDKKKVSIQFVPPGRRTFKCSHAPKEINSYEKQVKNPFYQNTQRLDELLENFLDKTVRDKMGQPYSRTMIALKKSKHKNKQNEVKNKTPNKNVKDGKADFEVHFNDAKNKILKNSHRNNHNKNINNNIKNNNNNNRILKPLPLDDNFKFLEEQIAKNKIMADYYNKNNQRTDTDDLKEFLSSHGGAMQAKITTSNINKQSSLKKGKIETTSPNCNLLMSISTMVYKDNGSPFPMKNPEDNHKVKDHATVGRRLMQIEMEDDEEVSIMPASERDNIRRERRDDEPVPNNLVNPNWKGPMPLYPDEINSISKPGPVIITTEENPETESILFTGPKNRKPYRFKSRGPADSKDPEYFTDMEYIEDYFRKKYDRVADLAQAYSDYGVLNDKSSKNERVDQRFRHYEKVDSDTTPGIKVMGVQMSSPSTSPTEGFRFQIFPSSSHLDGVFKALKKHVKFTGAPDHTMLRTTDKTFEPFTIPTVDSFETTKSEVLDVKNILKIDKPPNMDFEYRNIKKRSLKSVDYYEHDPTDAIESLMNFRGIFNGLQKKFSTKLGSAQDYAIRVASDYIHDGIYKRDVDTVDVDIVNDSIAEDNITVSDNIMETHSMSDIYNITEAVKLIANIDNTSAQTIDTGVKIATGKVDNDTGTSLSDFFMKLSHWFSLLDTLDLSVNKSQPGNFSATNKTTGKTNNQAKFEISFPLYDADMIENIGHRSRVLLTVNETESVDDRTTDSAGKDVGDAKSVGVVGTEIENTTTPNLETVNAKDNKTKSIVKRNADGNLFWDDVYNDDYGPDVDNTDGIDASKNVPSYASNPEKKYHSKDWFRKMVAKFKEAANLQHKQLNNRKGAEKKDSLHKTSKPKEGKVKPKKPIPKEDLVVVVTKSKRFYRKADTDYPMEEKRTDFAALTAKMKKICQKAAKDISLSKKLEVHQESKEEQVASKLMQQLVGLMSNLVDYQVHEKTCRKLPLDLQNFLEWLTNPESTVMTYHGKDTVVSHNNKEQLEDIQMLEVMPPGEERPEPKADYMSVMSSVRDLLNRYESLSEDDKRKMSGVRDYLDAQMEYLQKQLYMTNDFNMFNTDISRFKRDAKVSSPNQHLTKANSVYVTFRKYMRKQIKGKHNDKSLKKTHYNKLTKSLISDKDEASTTSKVMTIALAIDGKTQ